MDTLEHFNCFVSTVYVIKKPEFLEPVNTVSARYLEQSKEFIPDAKITRMTGSYAHEPELEEFSRYISQTAWNILSSQGYAMDNLVTYFTEMWTQEHNNHSSMDYHVHGHGAQISAFYFLDTPPEGCQLIVHDPRPAKVIVSLPPKDDRTISSASQHIVLTPDAGTLILANAWLPHSFSRNNSDTPMRFVHMNLTVLPAPEQKAEVEVI